MRKETANVPGAERTTEDGRIIHSWDGPDDPENPFNWATWYKWVLTVTVCFVSILTGLPAGSYGVGASYYSSQFNILTAPFDNSIWATVSWNIGAAVWPLIFVPLTEAKGRMPGYVLNSISVSLSQVRVLVEQAVLTRYPVLDISAPISSLSHSFSALHLLKTMRH